MGLIKSIITLALIAGAVFFYSSGPINTDNPGIVNQENNQTDKTVLEASQVTQLDKTLSSDTSTLAITSDGSEAFIAGEQDQTYPSEVEEDVDGLRPLETSVFQEVYMIGTDGIKDLSNFSITGFDGEESVELASFAGSSMSHITDVDKGGEHVFIGYNKKISMNDSGIKAYTLIYDIEDQVIEKTVELEGLPRAGAVLAEENGFYAVSEGTISRYGMDGERMWQVNLDYPDLTRGSPYPVLEKEGGNIYMAMSVSNGHHEIIAAKISSDGQEKWSRKLDLEGLKEQASAVTVSDNGFLIASTSKYVDSMEPLITYPRDVVLKNLDLSDGNTEWTRVYNNPESSSEKVLRLEDADTGFKALMEVRKMIEADARPIESGIETTNSLMKISSSGNITEVVNTESYSTDKVFKLDSIYGMRENNISKLQRANKQDKSSQPDYYSKETYRERAAKKGNNWYQKLRDTAMNIEAFDSEGNLHLRITNTGERTISSENLTAYYATPRFSPVEYRILEIQGESDLILEDRNNQCLTQDTELSSGESLSCLTGLKYPEEKRIEIEIMAENIDYQKTLTVH